MGISRMFTGEGAGRTESFTRLMDTNTRQSIEYFTDEAEDLKDIGSWVFTLEEVPGGVIRGPLTGKGI